LAIVGTNTLTNLGTTNLYGSTFITGPTLVDTVGVGSISTNYLIANSISTVALVANNYTTYGQNYQYGGTLMYGSSLAFMRAEVGVSPIQLNTCNYPWRNNIDFYVQNITGQVMNNIDVVLSNTFTSGTYNKKAGVTIFSPNEVMFGDLGLTDGYNAIVVLSNAGKPGEIPLAIFVSTSQYTFDTIGPAYPNSLIRCLVDYEDFVPYVSTTILDANRLLVSSIQTEGISTAVINASSIVTGSLAVTGTNTFTSFGNTFLIGTSYVSGPMVQVGNAPMTFTSLDVSSLTTSSLTVKNTVAYFSVGTAQVSNILFVNPQNGGLSNLYANSAGLYFEGTLLNGGGGGSVSSNIGFSNVGVLGTISSFSTVSRQIRTSNIEFVNPQSGGLSNLYVQNGGLFFEGTLVGSGGSYVSSNFGFSNVGVLGTISSLSTATGFLSTTTTQTSNIQFINPATGGRSNLYVQSGGLYFEGTQLGAGGGGPTPSNLTLESLVVQSSTILQGPTFMGSALTFTSSYTSTVYLPMSTIYTSVDGSNWTSIVADGFSQVGMNVRSLPIPGGYSTIAVGAAESLLYRSTATTFVSSSNTVGLFDAVTHDITVGWVVPPGKSSLSRYFAVGRNRLAPNQIVYADNDPFTSAKDWGKSYEFDSIYGGRGIAYNSTLNRVVAVGGATSDAKATIVCSEPNPVDFQPALSGGFENSGTLVGYAVATSSINNIPMFIAVGAHEKQTSTIQYSLDGSNWDGIKGGGFNRLDVPAGDIAFGHNMAVAVGCGDSEQSTIQYTVDGSNWNTSKSGGFIANGKVPIYAGLGIAYHNGLWVATGNHKYLNSSIQYSTDGMHFHASQTGNLPFIAEGPSGYAVGYGVGYDTEVSRWYVTTELAYTEQPFYVPGTQITSTSVLTDQISATTVAASNIQLLNSEDTSQGSSLYNNNGKLYFNDAEVGGTSITSNWGFSNLVVYDTFSTMNIFTSTIHTSTVQLIDSTDVHSSLPLYNKGGFLYFNDSEVGGTSITSNWGFSNLTVYNTLSTASIFASTIHTSTVQLIDIIDNSKVQPLYNKGGSLYFNDTEVGASITSNWGFSNLTVYNTLSTVSLTADFISAGTVTVSNLTFTDGTKLQGTNIAIGSSAGASQGVYSVAIGIGTGQAQGSSAVAIGNAAGNNQDNNVVAIGVLAGQFQGPSAIAVGSSSGNNQGNNAIAIGGSSGNSQGDSAIAVGSLAGQTQGNNAIALGNSAGHNQLTSAIAIGNSAGHIQSTSAIAIGTNTGYNQGQNAIAIGSNAGYNTGGLQGINSIAIGAGAGYSAAHPSTIILNALGSNVNSQQEASLYVAPVRTETNIGTFSTLYYDNTKFEVVAGPQAPQFRYGTGTLPAGAFPQTTSITFTTSFQTQVLSINCTRKGTAGAGAITVQAPSINGFTAAGDGGIDFYYMAIGN